MTWEPTHVQFTVLRARNLPTKSKGGSKLTDVYVAVQLGKEKFQTSTIKNALNPEWFEQCDLQIPHMHSEVQLNVNHRGMLSDDFIGYCTVPLWQYKVYERPSSQWVQLQGKPNKTPDNKYRGEIEVRLAFSVKSKQEEISSNLNKKKSSSIKGLASAMGQKVGDKFKFVRSKSLRDPHFSSPPAKEPLAVQSNNAIQNVVAPNSSPLSNQNSPENPQGAALSKGISSSFSALDIVPPNWDEPEASERRRSQSMSLRRSGGEIDKTGYENVRQYNQPGNRQSLPASYLGTQTLPHPKGKRYGQSRRSADDLDSTVSSQPGYLESIFRKESEVFKTMTESANQAESEESIEKQERTCKSAKEYTEAINESYDSDSEGSVDISFPEVKQKSDSGLDSRNTSDTKIEHSNSNEASSSQLNNLSPDFNMADMNSSHTSVLNNDNEVKETSFPESSESPVYHNQRPNSFGPGQLNGENDELHDSLNHIKKKIAPEEKFTFGMSPDKPEPTTNGNVRRKSKKERSRGMGNRRYTVQGLDYPRRQNSLEDTLDALRPQFMRDAREVSSIPNDLIAVYRHMTKDELIRIVIQHKAQLIRKDQYVKDLEQYIDSLLVRVMEATPRILQQGNRFK